MPLLSLPNELLLHIAEQLGPRDLAHFVGVNHFLATLLLPGLHKLALLDKDGIPALLWAANRGYEPLVRLLIDQGIDVNTTSGYYERLGAAVGATALHMAVTNGSGSIVNLLVCNGANIEARDEYGITPFRMAAALRKTRVLRLLRDLGAFVDVLDKGGRTTLQSECEEEKNQEMISLLLDLGVNVNAKGRYAHTALHYTFVPNESPDLTGEVVQMLLARGADVNAQNESGYTPLFFAASFYTYGTRLPQLLLDAGADVNIRNHNGLTALSFSLMWNGVLEVFQLLVERGADTTLGYIPTSNTALHIAAQKHDVSVVRCLLRNTHGINLQNTAGETPLHLAAKRNDVEVFKLLLENGADIEIRDLQGNTADDLLVVQERDS